MGLFSNNKKLCPICGAPTPRLFPTKVEGLPICKECDAKIELPDGALDQMDLEQFKAYMDFYEKNGELRSSFTETDKYDFGYMGGCMVVDTAHGLFKRRNDENAIVMESKNLKSFRILEDENVLFESKNGMLVCHKSDIPKRANDLSPLVTQFQMRLQEYEWREEEERRRAQSGRQETPQERSDRERAEFMRCPTFDAPELFRNFYIELQYEHPYWTSERRTVDAPKIDSSNPSVDGYLQKYYKTADKLHNMASCLIQLICPGAQEVNEGEAAATASTAPAQAAPAVDAVTEIKKYKELLDAGIITDEEFQTKKRQLMGI